jgi:integrase/recombinase XerC
MEHLLNNFLNYIQFERRFSNHTITSYKTDLKQFFKYIETTYNVISIEEVSHAIIRSWIVELKENEISNKTINRKISTLKTLYKYLLKQHITTINPMLKIIAPKQAKRLPTFFNDETISKILEGDFFSKDFNGYRDALILDLLYSTGIRLQELITIKESSINDKQLKVLGKRNKERIIPITDRLNGIINQYVKLKSNQNFENKIECLLVTDKGLKLYDKFVYRRVNYYISLVSTEKKRSPHTLRHSFATNMLNNGAQLHSIKELLGHSSLAATEVYTHNSIKKLKDTYKKYHPKLNNN